MDRIIQTSVSATYYRRLINKEKSLNRNIAINAAIEYFIDSIYLAMFSRRWIFKTKSVKHINKAIIQNFAKANKLLTEFYPTAAELPVFNKLQELYLTIRTDKDIKFIFSNATMVESLILRASQDDPDCVFLAKYASLVLSMAGQLSYKDITVVIPDFQLGYCNETPFVKSLVLVKCGFSLERLTARNPISVDSAWYNLFSGLYVPQGETSQVQAIRDLCQLLAIDVIPDAATGIGIRQFPFESVASSQILRNFKIASNGYVVDATACLSRLRANNIWANSIENTDVFTGDNMEVGSCEADYTDNVGGGGGDESPPTQNPDTTNPEENVDDQGADQNVEPQPPQPTNDSNVPQQDQTNDPATATDIETAKTTLLGLDLELPKNETLDDFLYRMTVANYIDNVATFNHDELPLETVALLSKWKSMFLFLVAVKETKRFLKELKIKPF